MKRTTQKNDVFDFIKSQALKNGKILINQLSDFTQKERITFEELNPLFLEDFKNFLSTRYTSSYSGTFEYLKLLKKLCLIAVELGITDNYPFASWSIPPYQKPKPYFTSYQLQKLRQVRHLIKPVVCQAFYFILFTGIKVHGLRQLTIVQAKNMNLKRDAKKLLQTIINRRINEDEALFKGLPNDARMSCILRLWGALASLKQKPTLYCARNTHIVQKLKRSNDLRKTFKELGLVRFQYQALLDALSYHKTENTSL